MAARITPIFCIALGVFLYWAAMGSDFPQAYVFPKMLAGAMVILGGVMLVMTFGKTPKPASTKIDVAWSKLWPGILILVIYMGVAQSVGFYVSSWLAFASLGTIYAPSSSGLATAKRCVPISAAFLTVLYLVFWMLLRVQMPQGIAF